MSKKSLPIITINREYGAGGRSLAAILSEKLGIPYYDRDFVAKTVTESGYDMEAVEREGEEMTESSRVLNSFLNSAVSYKSSHDAIFQAEKKVILELAKDPCIMVGRCADRILAEAGFDVFSIYLHAPREMRLESAQRLKEHGEENPEKFMENHDNQRRIFYKEYTGCEIFDATNYTVCFDMGKISIEQCTDFILTLLGQS